MNTDKLLTIISVILISAALSTVLLGIVYFYILRPMKRRQQITYHVPDELETDYYSHPKKKKKKSKKHKKHGKKKKNNHSD